MVKLYIERNANRYKRTGRTVQYTAQLALWANYISLQGVRKTQKLPQIYNKKIRNFEFVIFS